MHGNKGEGHPDRQPIDACANRRFKLATFTFTEGLLMVAAVEEMLSEAHESDEDTHISILAFVGDFVLFVLVSAGLEGLLPLS